MCAGQAAGSDDFAAAFPIRQCGCSCVCVRVVVVVGKAGVALLALRLCRVGSRHLTMNNRVWLCSNTAACSCCKCYQHTHYFGFVMPAN